MKKKEVKEIAERRTEFLVASALKERDEGLAQAQARRAKKVAMHFRVRLPYMTRQLYCKQCKQLIVPDRTARVRLGRSGTRAVRISCLKCGHVYRKIIPRARKNAEAQLENKDLIRDFADQSR